MKGLLQSSTTGFVRSIKETLAGLEVGSYSRTGSLDDGWEVDGGFELETPRAMLGRGPGSVKPVEME